MGLELELYGENWGVLTVDIDNKILVTVWMNYKKVVRFENELLLNDNFVWKNVGDIILKSLWGYW